MLTPPKLSGALRTAFLCLAIFPLSPVSVRADWASFGPYAVLIQADVEEHAVTLNVRLRLDALKELRERLALEESASQAELTNHLLLLVADGKPVPPALIEHPREVSSTANQAATIPYCEMEARYPLSRRPALIKLAAPESIAKNISFVVLHRGVPVNDQALLIGTTRLKLDWSHPWNSRFEDPTLVRRHSEPRSYVYVEPYEVRHELLLRLDDLMPVLNIPHADPHRIGPEQRVTLQSALAGLLQERNPLRIDGTIAKPRLDRLEFVRYTRSGLAGIGPEEYLDTSSSVVGAILVYFTETPAATLELEWNLPVIVRKGESRGISLQYGKETFDSYVTATDPVFRWSKEEAFEPPAGEFPASVTGQTAQAALPALLHNVYRAFQIAEEEAAYDRLALSLEGEILDDVYLRQRRALLQRNRGMGGDGRVERIEPLETRTEAVDSATGATTIFARWIAHGTVSHWGHSHPRSNVYAAHLNLRPVPDGGWKITGLDFTEGRAREAS